MSRLVKMAGTGTAGYVSSLQKIAEKSLLKGLGEVACGLSSVFCCGGNLETSGAILIAYRSREKSNLLEIRFPGASEADLSKLIYASSIASFGRGTEQVTDKCYIS